MLDLDDKVTAAAVAAAGTVIGSLIQLRVSWRKEVSERARGVPSTKKSRRGPVLAVGLLLVGAAAGGFAFSQYLVKQSDVESAALRAEEERQWAPRRPSHRRGLANEAMNKLESLARSVISLHVHVE